MLIVDATGINVSVDPQIDSNGDGIESPAERQGVQRSARSYSSKRLPSRIPKLSLQWLNVQADRHQQQFPSWGSPGITKTSKTKFGTALEMDSVTVGITDFALRHFGGQVIFDGDFLSQPAMRHYSPVKPTQPP
ncbi:MAG UNVERIFIED_CONTAM: hypothetical protein LVR18_39940 [Planctomycetaceae bacterium]